MSFSKNVAFPSGVNTTYATVQKVLVSAGAMTLTIWVAFYLTPQSTSPAYVQTYTIALSSLPSANVTTFAGWMDTLAQNLPIFGGNLQVA